MERFCCDNSSNKISAITNENLEQIQLLQYGERLQYDRTFKGPLSKRSCTDMFCLFLFFVFLIAWAYIGNYAVQNGDLNKLLVPTDSLNRKCGVDGQVLDKKFLFFFNLEKCIDPLVPITGCPTPQVCVARCPTQTFVWDTMKNSLSLQELKNMLICQSENDKNSITSITDAEIAMNENRCARWYVQSKPFLNRCLWTFSPDRCEYIPSFLRSLKLREISTYLPQTTTTYSSFVLFPSNENAEIEVITKDKTAQTYANLKEAKEPTLQCSTRQKLGESIIKEKMIKANSFLSKLVGNFVSHFYSGLEAQQVGEQIVEDIINTWLTIILALGIVIVISLIFISLMRWMAAPIVWFSILGVLSGLCFGVYYSITQYNYWKERPTVPYHSLNISSTLKNIFQQQTTWFYASVVMSIALSVISLLLVVIRKRIRIAIALVKEGSKAVSCVVSTVFFPMFPWVLYLFSITLALGIGLHLQSVGDPVFKMIKLKPSEEICICEGPGINYTVGLQCNPKVFQENCFAQPINPTIRNLLLPKKNCIDTGCYFEGFGKPKMITFFQVYNVIGFLWLSFFISGLGDMVLAATFASWYWTFRKSDVPYFVLSKAFGKVIRYHLGTLALGAFVLTICRVLRIVLEFIDHKLKKFDNSVTRGILCCMKCFFWALENFLRFINRNAYIMCAIHGKNFCDSAKDSFNLLMRNFLRVIAVDKITDFLFFLSKLLLTGTTGIGTYYYFVANPDHRLNYIGVPITLVVIATYLITSVFFGVYSMAVDTLFLCFLEDCERNDGSEEKPYFMSKQLMGILQKRNKMPKK